jgi:putative ABC transport system substrate-binding protein
MRRRDFKEALPLAGRLPRVRRSGSRCHASAISRSPSAAWAFREGLHALGYVEGQNVLVEDRRAGKPSQLDDLAAELVVSKVDIIACGGSQATRAALAQTKTIPIVTLSSDPIAVGFVGSLAKPGGNVTGVSLLAPDLAGKRLALLKELIPSVTNVALLWNPDDPTVHLSVEESKAAAARLLLTLQILETREAGAIQGAITAAANERTQALVLMPTPLYDGQAQQIAELAMSMRLPTVHFSKHAVQRGILMSYGPDLLATIRRQAYFVDRILKGAKPADLPVEQPTTFELAINLKTAKVLGLAVPSTLLTTADEVIE